MTEELPGVGVAAGARKARWPPRRVTAGLRLSRVGRCFRPLTRKVLTSFSIAILLSSCGSNAPQRSPGGDASAGTDAPEIEGLQTFSDLERTHVAGPVDYTKDPPVGGNHSGNLQTCGAYDSPVPNELAVHTLEHGAVWLTYSPDLPPSEVDLLRRAARQPYVLVSPYPGLPAPIVATSWGRQLRLESARDDRLEQFVTRFRNSPEAPEPGAVCVDQGSPLPQDP